MRTFILLSVMLPLLTTCTPAEGNLSPSPRREDATLMSWIPYWDQENAFEAFRKQSGLFDQLSFFWYRLDSEGKIRTYADAEEDPSLVRFAREQGVLTFALIANLPDDGEEMDDWDPERVDRVIASAPARALHITDLVALAEKLHFDGIDIDYEALETRQRENFSRFIEELASALHAKGKLLRVALHPKTSEINPMEDNGSHAQDWKRLMRSADFLTLMAFGEHYAGGEPGPVASLPWLERNIRYAVETIGIPRDKLTIELPLFGEHWAKEDGEFVGESDELPLSDAETIRKRNRARVQWDASSASPYFTFKKGGKEHIIWLENARSLTAKLTLLERYGITHIAYWRLGGETKEVWRLLKML